MKSRPMRRLTSLLLLALARGEMSTMPTGRLGCTSSSVFDFAGLSCLECSEGFQPDTKSTACRCPPTSLQARVECSIESMWQGACQGVECSSECDLLSQVSSLDQSRCVSCSGDSAIRYGLPKFDIESNQCKCDNPPRSAPTDMPVVSYRLVEIYNDVTGLPFSYDCLRCPDGTAAISSDIYRDGMQYHSTAGVRYSSDSSKCASCPDHHMFFDTDYNCKCKEGFILTGEASLGPQSCIERYPTITSNYEKAKFSTPVAAGAALDKDAYDFSLNSIIYSHYYLKSASLCEYFQGISDESLRACQTLGNICAMNMFDNNSAACKQYSIISQRRLGTYHGQQDWKQTLPWLYYSTEGNDVVNDKGVKMKMAFNDEWSHLSTTLTFKLAKYTLDGSFVGIETMSNQFEYCSSDKSAAGWTRFGQTYRLEYSCNIGNLVDDEMFFYDLYLVDNSVDTCKGESNDMECLYPVPVLNRNFIEDGVFPNMNLSTLDEDDDKYTRRFFLFDNMSGRTSSGLEAIRYARSIMLLIQVQSEDPSKLTPPRLIIEYQTKALDPAQKEKPISDSLFFKVDYSMKTDTFWESIQIIIGFIAALALVVYGIKMNNWQTRQPPQSNEQQYASLTSIKFIVHAVMMLCHTFVLLFFPFAVVICSYWYLFFNLQDSVFLLLPSDNEFYRDVGNEYYFLMLAFWGLYLCQTVYLTYRIVEQCRSTIIFVDWERPKGRVNNQVSVWRKILVANEFLSMQTSRKHSIAFNLALLGVFVTFDDTSHGRHPNIALRFASTCFFWLSASCIQWIWRFLFYERWYHEPRGQRLVDLCSVSNISILVLTEQHKGYYIHGRSPYQCSDCSQEELLESFRKEANGFTVSRGLDAASQGHQVFTVFCSSVFRNQIDKIDNFVKLGQDGAGNDNLHIGKSELSNFVKGFIDQQPPPSQEGLKYIVKEPLISETVLGITPADFRQSDPKCIMLTDASTNWNRDYQFLSQTFIGIESDLLLHDILTFNTVDLLFSNTAISILVTYMMHLLRTLLASYFAKKNLANTSHIDERFLL